MDYKKKTMRGFAWLIAASLSVSLLVYVFKIIMARNLTPHDYGLYFSIMSVIALLSIIRNFGFDHALVKFIPKFMVGSRLKEIRSMFMFILSSRLIATIAISILILLSYGYIFAGKVTFGPLLFYIILLFIAQVGDGLIVSTYHGMQRFVMISLINISKPLLLIIFVSLAFFLGFKDASAAILSNALAFILVFLGFTFFLFYSRKDIFFNDSHARPVAKEIMIYSLPLIFLVAGKTVIQNVDTFLISLMKGFEQVAFYNVALSIANLLFIVEGAIVTVLFPLFSELIEKKRHDLVKNTLTFSYKFVMLASFPIMLFFYIFSKDIIGVLFGREYLTSLIPILILVLGNIFWILASINLSLINSQGNSKRTAYIIFLSSIINLLINLALIPSMGIVGAASATLLCYITMFAISAYYIRKSLIRKELISIIVTGTIFLSFSIPVFILTSRVAAFIALSAFYILLVLLRKNITLKEIRGIINNFI